MEIKKYLKKKLKMYERVYYYKGLKSKKFKWIKNYL